VGKDARKVYRPDETVGGLNWQSVLEEQDAASI
jgi:hypothetical protein